MVLNSQVRGVLLASVATVAIMAPAAATAQTAKASTNATLEEIVVTATRREERLQSVPRPGADIRTGIEQHAKIQRCEAIEQRLLAILGEPVGNSGDFFGQGSCKCDQRVGRIAAGSIGEHLRRSGCKFSHLGVKAPAPRLVAIHPEK